MNAERFIAVCRDAGCMTLGLVGIGWQQYTGQVNALLLGVYLTLLGIPVGVNAVQITRQARRLSSRGTTGTPVPQSSLPSPSSPSSPSSSEADA